MVGPTIARGENNIYGKPLLVNNVRNLIYLKKYFIIFCQYELPKSDQDLIEEMIQLTEEKQDKGNFKLEDEKNGKALNAENEITSETMNEAIEGNSG